jgi:hypothetical protein
MKDRIRASISAARLPHLCRLGLDGKVPDHSTFSRNRHGRFRESDILRHLFETTVQTCIDEGLVGGEGFACDASLIAADANKQRSLSGEDWDRRPVPENAARAVEEYLATLDEAAFGAASDVRPKFISPSDPAAQWTGANRGQAFFAYATNYLIDIENAVIRMWKPAGRSGRPRWVRPAPCWTGQRSVSA